MHIPSFIKRCIEKWFAENGAESLPASITTTADALSSSDEPVVFQYDVIVAGAGTSAANGTYTYRGQSGGKAYYNLEGEDDSETNNAIVWGDFGDGTIWYITNDSGVGLYELDNGGINPWENGSGAWANLNGSNPAPTVSSQLVAKRAPISLIGEALGLPKVYRALLSQTGTDAPVANVLQNDLSGEVVWTRDATGHYFGTLAGAFTADKTSCLIANPQQSDNDKPFFTFIRRDDANLVYVETKRFNAGSLEVYDEILQGTYVEILVYP